MFVSDQHRFLFIHVQKTGGVTVERRLQQLMPEGRTARDTDVQRHSRLSTVLGRYPELTPYFIFGVVRNPWSRMVSWWRMVERTRERAANGDPWAVARLHGPDPHPFWSALDRTCPDFRTFVHEGTEDWTRLSRPQVDFLVTDGRFPDFVGRQESLEADLRAVAARYDLPWTPLPPPENADPNPPPSYREYYDDATRERVGEVFAKDVAYFGYDF
ncbi:sulfotransferase family 2 domain-containing protein [Nocardioides sp. CFH 31398]|uniref:sulfotransferase family 2 domain-containing protein n=1 Tax=Nocardioides sp. CFH 31398 TaxID=2919579 RepID=UPI001F06553F|nr:sulfotransferase family 2 domain-containing protein [Nocardioides sp. CFH 31398]MCH1865891.1 sulfotransferase family protein [Nocardioides sp. CFH 31398]